MHWAAHGNTAAEVIFNRIDSTKPNLGLTTFKGATPSYQETEIAKNYLTEEEINILNRMVSAYLELAELQALNRKPMYMKDWVARLDGILQLNGRELLTHAGKISHDRALEKSSTEFEKYKLTQTTLDKEQSLKEIEEDIKRLKK